MSRLTTCARAAALARATATTIASRDMAFMKGDCRAGVAEVQRRLRRGIGRVGANETIPLRGARSAALVMLLPYAVAYRTVDVPNRSPVLITGGASSGGGMISFIIPAYNEESLLGATLRALHEAARVVGEPYEVIVADDGST